MGQRDTRSRVDPSESIFGPTGLVSKTPEISKHSLKPVEGLVISKCCGQFGSWLELCEVLWGVQKETKM